MPRKLTAVVPTSIVAPILAWLRNARDRRTLADMPDYLLKDIGLRRDEIDNIGVIVREQAAPMPAQARPAATVVALPTAKSANKPSPPEKPMAA